MFDLCLRMFAAEAINAVYQGVLRRTPDTQGASAYASQLGRALDLETLLKDVLRSDEFRQKMFAAIAPQLVREAFRGLLEREAEPEDVASYAAMLADKGQIDALLTQIAWSEEFRDRSFVALAPQLVRAAFRGLLQREAEPQGVASYSTILAETHELDALLAEIIGSQEFRDKSFTAMAPELVREVFRGLLQREAEPQAVASYAAAVAEKGQLRAVLAEVARSAEFRDKSYAALAPELVRAAFRGLLDRDPDPQALAAYVERLKEKSALAQVLAEISRSEEFREKRLPAPVAMVDDGAVAGRRPVPGFSAQDLELPKLVFLHHPKTGGTTLHNILVKTFSKEEICPERFNGLRHYAAGELARYRYFSGHFDLPSVKLIPGRKKTITMLREPVARLISLYYFQRAHKPEVVESNGLELARLANTFTMKEFFLAPEVRMHPAINNSMTRVLVDTIEGLRWEQKALANFDDMSQFLQLALRELSAFDTFGVMERYDDSVELICESIGLSVPTQIEQRQVLDVVMEEEPGLRRIEKEPVTDEIRELAASLVETDLKVYVHARTLFEQRLQTLRRRNSALRGGDQERWTRVIAGAERAARRANH